MPDGKSIYLSYDVLSSRGSYNEWLTVEHDDERLFFRAGGMPHKAGGTDVEKRKLDPQEAADYLWSVMMSQVQSRLR